MGVGRRDAADHRARDRYDLGLGWYRPASQRSADPPFVPHLGGGAGFYNLIRIYPTRGVGVAVMGNVTKYPIDAVARLALTHCSGRSSSWTEGLTEQ